MKSITKGTIKLFLIPIITILLISFISYYGYGQPFLSSIVWSILMIVVIFLRVYLSQKDSKILLFLSPIIGVIGVFIFSSKIFNAYSSALFITIVYIVTSSEILRKTFFKK